MICKFDNPSMIAEGLSLSHDKKTISTVLDDTKMRCAQSSQKIGLINNKGTEVSFRVKFKSSQAKRSDMFVWVGLCPKQTSLNNNAFSEKNSFGVYLVDGLVGVHGKNVKKIN